MLLLIKFLQLHDLDDLNLPELQKNLALKAYFSI